MLSSFIQWHLSIGFVRIYLYFDSPEDRGITVAKALRVEAARRGFDDAVRIVICDSCLKAEWSGLHTAQRWGDDVSKVLHHVEVRQMLNVEHCLRHAHADGDIDWLLHVDSDELFFIDDLEAASHFGRLSAHGCINFRYPIHEGCPEVVDSTNVFESVTLFRRHPQTLSAALGTDPAPSMRAAASGAFAIWQRDGRHYCLGSSQGKSATRVLPGAGPISVHAFHPPVASQLPKCWAGFADTQDATGESAPVKSPIGSPCILHYISCDFSFWWHKYRLLGRFSNEKPGGAAVGGAIHPECFHATSRDLVAKDGDRSRAREVYAASVCLLDPNEAARQVAGRICMRIDAVGATLAKWRSHVNTAT